MKKKVLSVILTLCFIFSPLMVYADSNSKVPEGVNNVVRIFDGIAEVIDNWILKMSFRQNYSGCEALCDIPCLDEGYIPQGFCFIDSMNLYAVSAYKSDSNSIISLIDAETGKTIKTVKLCYADGSACKSHAGGVADIGDYLFVSTGKSMNRIKISDILSAENFSEVAFCGKISADMQASNACSYGNYLFIGKFYSFTLDGSYDSDPSQWVKGTDGKRYYAMCEVFDMSNMEEVIENEGAVPVAVLTLPNSVQGIAYDGKYFYTSSSSSCIGYSYVKKFILEDFETDYYTEMNGQNVPLIMLTKDKQVDMVKLPPMVEGIDIKDGNVHGIFESGADKFPIVSVRTPYICKFTF